jgi:hypothetical protein
MFDTNSLAFLALASEDKLKNILHVLKQNGVLG